jgi:hypothetical protein
VSLESQLKARSEGIVEHLLAKQYAKREEIDAMLAEHKNPNDPESTLILTYGALRVLLDERTPDAGDRDARRKRADRVVLDSLRGASRPVTLTAPIEDLREVSVHPKSMNALIELAERDAVIGFFNAGLDALRELVVANPTPDRVEHLARGVREVGYQERICVWIVTHPGPGLPYPEEVTTPELPDWLSYLSPVDALLIFAAHEDVNAGRLAALQALPRGKKRADDVERGWGVYLANMASLMNRSAEQLARDHSLASLFAQSYVHAIEQERQMEEAEKK